MIVLQDTANVTSNGVKSLIYGGSGVGKTRLLATAPSPVIFSAESGLLSLRQYHLPYAQINTMAELQEAYSWSIGSHEARQFATIGVDSISEIIEKLLTYEKGLTKDPRKAYGAIVEKGVQLCRDFRDIPGKNIVIVAKQEFAKDETTGGMMFQPSLPGQKLGPALPYYFDEVFQVCNFPNQQNPQQPPITALRCKRDHQNEAKDRSGALDMWEPPDLGRIYAKIANAGAIAR
jgi:hypothetical protein